MKRRLTLAVGFCLIATALLLIAVSVASAARPLAASAGPMKASKASMETPVLAPASGVWTWWGVDGGYWESSLGSNLYFWSNGERGSWTGTFNGTSVEPYSGVVGSNDTMWALITINFRGKVAGHRGSAVIGLTVDSPSPFGDTMGGHWAVMSGTGGLKHLFGLGLWEFTGTDETGTYGYADYTGAYWLPSCGGHH